MKLHSLEWRKYMSKKMKGRKVTWANKISEGVKRQWAEGRGNAPGFTNEQRQKAYKKTWKGENVSNVGLHQWIRRKKGAPMVCDHCGRKDKKKYEWANIDHKYRRVLEDYIRLCTSCHRIYDIENNDYDNHRQWHKLLNGDYTYYGNN